MPALAAPHIPDSIDMATATPTQPDSPPPPPPSPDAQASNSNTPLIVVLGVLLPLLLAAALLWCVCFRGQRWGLCCSGSGCTGTSTEAPSGHATKTSRGRARIKVVRAARAGSGSRRERGPPVFITRGPLAGSPGVSTNNRARARGPPAAGVLPVAGLDGRESTGESQSSSESAGAEGLGPGDGEDVGPAEGGLQLTPPSASMTSRRHGHNVMRYLDPDTDRPDETGANVGSRRTPEIIERPLGRRAVTSLLLPNMTDLETNEGLGRRTEYWPPRYETSTSSSSSGTGGNGAQKGG